MTRSLRPVSPLACALGLVLMGACNADSDPHCSHVAPDRPLYQVVPQGLNLVDSPIEGTVLSWDVVDEDSTETVIGFEIEPESLDLQSVRVVVSVAPGEAPEGVSSGDGVTLSAMGNASGSTSLVLAGTLGMPVLLAGAEALTSEMGWTITPAVQDGRTCPVRERSPHCGSSIHNKPVTFQFEAEEATLLPGQAARLGEYVVYLRSAWSDTAEGGFGVFCPEGPIPEGFSYSILGVE